MNDTEYRPAVGEQVFVLHTPLGGAWAYKKGKVRSIPTNPGGRDHMIDYGADAWGDMVTGVAGPRNMARTEEEAKNLCAYRNRRQEFAKHGSITCPRCGNGRIAHGGTCRCGYKRGEAY